SPSALHPVQAANSNPKKVAPNSTTTAPRPVSLIDTDPRGRGCEGRPGRAGRAVPEAPAGRAGLEAPPGRTVPEVPAGRTVPEAPAGLTGAAGRAGRTGSAGRAEP